MLKYLYWDLSLFWSDDNEIAKLKSDLSKNKEKLTRALEYKADREELKDHLRKSKEAIALQREETEQVRKDLDEERHSLKMAQWVKDMCCSKGTYSHSREFINSNQNNLSLSISLSLISSFLFGNFLPTDEPFTLVMWLCVNVKCMSLHSFFLWKIFTYMHAYK